VKPRIIFVVACLAMIGMAPAVHAADGWRLAKLNPFHKKTAKEKTRANVSDDDNEPGPPSLFLPKERPDARDADRETASEEPAEAAETPQTSKSFLGKTADFLMPWRKNRQPAASPPPPPPRKPERTSVLSSLLPKKKKSSRQ
jgi:hypothetical protein